MIRKWLMFFCVTTFLILAAVNAKQRFYQTFYVDVPLDHFSFAVNKTFKLRFLLNDTFWNKDDGPVLFYTGNEGPIELFAEHTGFLWKMAIELNGLVVFAEHRYYGKSLPFGNESLTPHNIGYLTSTQAIADFVDVISYILKDKASQERNPVYAMGGSYGGMLSAYIRMKYPHVVHGAIAASAPILQFQRLTPCDGFYQIVTSTFRSENDMCSDNIKKSWNAIRNVSSTADGRSWISEEFKLCKPLSDAKNDIAVFNNWLIGTYTNLAMVNYPYANDFLTPLPAFPVREACHHLHNVSSGDKPLLQAIFKAVSIFKNSTGTIKCNDLKVHSSSNIGTTGWSYQACTEMVMPKCKTGVYDMFFDDPFNEDEFTSHCENKWLVKPAYKLPIDEYGGNNLKYFSNIIFSNGLLDPWASGGVLRNYSNSIIAIIIPEGAHHLDLMDDNVDDPDSIIQARLFYKNTIMKWINDYQIN